MAISTQERASGRALRQATLAHSLLSLLLLPLATRVAG
jgi:hypothetical protein